MLTKFIFLLVFMQSGVYSIEEPIPFEDCGSAEDVFNNVIIFIKGCNKNQCQLKANEIGTLNIFWTARTIKVKNFISTLEISYLPFFWENIEINPSDACKVSKCPIEINELVNYRANFTIKDIDCIDGVCELRWSGKINGNSNLICAKMKIQIKK